MHFLNYTIWYNHCDEQWEILHVGRTEAKTVLIINNNHKLLRWFRRLNRKGVFCNG